MNIKKKLNVVVEQNMRKNMNVAVDTMVMDVKIVNSILMIR
jgi:hypothetical protein